MKAKMSRERPEMISKTRKMLLESLVAVSLFVNENGFSSPIRF